MAHNIRYRTCGHTESSHDQGSDDGSKLIKGYDVTLIDCSQYDPDPSEVELFSSLDKASSVKI